MIQKKLLYLILLFSLIVTTNANAQKLIYEERPNMVRTINDKIPPGTALLIFESELDLKFESSMEVLSKPIKKGDLYKILLSERTCVIDVNVPNSNVKINFGQMTQNSFHTLKTGEVKYFYLKLENRLKVINQTNDEEKDELSETQMRYEKEALIIINIDPTDMNLNFKSTEPITDVDKVNDRYLLYVKPKDQIITIEHKESGAYESIVLKDLKVKDLRYYFASLPDNLRQSKTNESYDSKVEIGDYLIMSNPSGALIQLGGQPDFNAAKHVTPYTLSNYKKGTYIITLSFDEYETEQDTINFDRKTQKNKLNKELIPMFAFINCSIEPAMPVSKISIEGKELVSITNGQPYKCSKGINTVEISAPHFYSILKKISFDAGKTVELKATLMPKMGSLTILSGINALGSEVYVNENKIGNIPIENYSLQEGIYTVSFKKAGFISEKSFYSLEIPENKIVKFEDLAMINTKEVRITTLPVSRATVYIDNEKLTDKSNLNISLGIGEHSIKIEKKYYKTYSNTFIVDNKQNEFTFNLEELSDPDSFDSNRDFVTAYYRKHKWIVSYGYHNTIFMNMAFAQQIANGSLSNEYGHAVTLCTNFFPINFDLTAFSSGFKAHNLAPFNDNASITHQGIEINMNYVPVNIGRHIFPYLGAGYQFAQLYSAAGSMTINGAASTNTSMPVVKGGLQFKFGQLLIFGEYKLTIPLDGSTYNSQQLSGGIGWIL